MPGQGKHVPYTEMEINTVTKLTLIAKRAREDRSVKFTSLMHLLNTDYLKECYKLLKKRKAAGVDGRTLESYTEEEINQAIEEAVIQLKSRRYSPQPVRRVYIKKENGKRRQLGIPTVIDKIVQIAMSRILETIYEADFLTVSYGYRPGRNAHECLKEINHMIMKEKVNWIIDCDIESFYDHIDHSLMLKCLSVRVADPNFKRLIGRFLKAGVMEGGQYMPSLQGTVQGGNISPVLANIYLHYVLDVWFEKREKKKHRGHVQLVRYADDFLIGTQSQEETGKIRRDVEARLKTFGLTLSKEKTKVKEFGRFARENSTRRGMRPETVDFLGFTHYLTNTRDGRFMVRMKTSRTRMNKAIVSLNTWLKTIRNKVPTETIWQLLSSKLQGHYNYYGVSGNFEGINRYYRKTLCLTYKWMNRRSRKKSWNRQRYRFYLETYPLPKPKLNYAIYNTW